jgi:hypothetical protein
MDGGQSAGLPAAQYLDQCEKMLLGAAIHLLESSQQPQRPDRPEELEGLVDVANSLFRPGRPS